MMSARERCIKVYNGNEKRERFSREWKIDLVNKKIKALYVWEGEGGGGETSFLRL